MGALSLRELHHLLNEIRGLEIGSLQCESYEDGQETDLAQNIAGPPDQDPLTLCLAGERTATGKGDRTSPEREQQVLMLYYQQELTMREVGQLMGVGESRVSQIPHLAVEQLPVCDVKFSLPYPKLAPGSSVPRNCLRPERICPSPIPAAWAGLWNSVGRCAPRMRRLERHFDLTHSERNQRQC